MSLVITQHVLDRSALVLIVGEDGLLEWSSTRDAKSVARKLRRIAAAITKEPAIGKAQQ